MSFLQAGRASAAAARTQGPGLPRRRQGHSCPDIPAPTSLATSAHLQLETVRLDGPTAPADGSPSTSMPMAPPIEAAFEVNLAAGWGLGGRLSAPAPTATPLQGQGLLARWADEARPASATSSPTHPTPPPPPSLAVGHGQVADRVHPHGAAAARSSAVNEGALREHGCMGRRVPCRHGGVLQGVDECSQRCQAPPRFRPTRQKISAAGTCPADQARCFVGRV
jgi:hypothetical protein